MKVFHLKDGKFPTLNTSGLQFPEDYELAAEVEAEDLEVAFFLTNSIDHSWHKNEGAKPTGASARSTSTGDVVVDDNDKAWMCEMVGWRELEGVES